MLINKMGSSHIQYGINNQDFGFEYKNIACLADGCSEGKHSEVGVKIFLKQFKQYLKTIDTEQDEITIEDIKLIFENVMQLLISSDEYLDDMRDYLCFTIILSQKIKNEWIVTVYGDGCLILQDIHDEFEFKNINHSSTPNYLVYQYINWKDLKDYQNEEYFYQRYSLNDYKNIFIASDGLLYIVGSIYENDFKQLLLEQKEGKINRFINKLNYIYKDGNGFFKDDITIIVNIEKGE